MKKNYSAIFFILLLFASFFIAKVFLYFIPFSVPLDTKPSGESTARALATTVARQAKCGNIELSSAPNNSFIYTCEVYEKNKMSNPFSITILTNESDKDYQIEESKNSMQTKFFKVGDYYIVSEDIILGKNGKPENVRTAENLAGFPGELY